MNMKLFTTALLATGATAAWANNEDLSQDLGEKLHQSYQAMSDVERRSIWVSNSIFVLL